MFFLEAEAGEQTSLPPNTHMGPGQNRLTAGGAEVSPRRLSEGRVGKRRIVLKNLDLRTEAGEERSGFSGWKLSPTSGHFKSSRSLSAFCSMISTTPNLQFL